MKTAELTLVNAGGRDRLISDFRALGEATSFSGEPRYSPKPTLAWLARFLVGQEGGPNKDLPLFELCHLINGVNACSDSAGFRSTFFFGGERAVPGSYKRIFEDAVADGGWCRTGFELTPEGIVIAYEDSSFAVRFGRMPMLGALYEFLASMEDFSFFEELNQICDDLAADDLNTSAVQKATGRLSSRLRHYRRAYLATAEQDGRFAQVMGFLKGRDTARSSGGEKESSIIIDDGAILDFWRLHSQGKEFKGYRTVFDLFVTVMKSLEETAQLKASSNAARLGVDWEAGEVDPHLDDLGDTAGDWQSPLAIFDEEPVASVKFFKQTSERKPLENLMHYGPKAAALPLAFLRFETFGQVQAGITNDLQVGRGRSSVERRLTCDEAETYQQRQETLLKLRGHVKELQKAALHVLAEQKGFKSAPDAESNVIAFPGTQLPDDDALDGLRKETANAFKRLTRKGFDHEAFTDPSRAKAFSLAAGALLAMGGQLEAFIAKVERLEKVGLDDLFNNDKVAFSRQFNALYGEKS